MSSSCLYGRVKFYYFTFVYFILAVYRSVTWKLEVFGAHTLRPGSITHTTETHEPQACKIVVDGPTQIRGVNPSTTCVICLRGSTVGARGYIDAQLDSAGKHTG